MSSLDTNMNNITNNNNYGTRDEFKSYNYEPCYMNRGVNINRNDCSYRTNNPNNLCKNGVQMNQNYGYGSNNCFKPTPSGERLRNAASNNFL